MPNEQQAALCEASINVRQRPDVILLALDKMLVKRSERREAGDC